MDQIKSECCRIKTTIKHPVQIVAIVLFLALDVTMMIVGGIEKDECPIEENIPLYLILAGVIGVLAKIVPIINSKLDSLLIHFVICFLYGAEVGWTIRGSIWVYSIYKPNFDEENGPYCSESAYLLSFSLLTIRWIFLGLLTIFVCSCCCLCVVSMGLKNKRSNNSNTVTESS